MNDTITFGGSRYLKLTGTFLKWLASLNKWVALTLFNILKIISKWLTSKSVSMLLNSEKHTLKVNKVKFIDRFTKRYQFEIDGEAWYCYEMGKFKDLYIEFKDKDIPLTEQDVYYCRFNTNSIK